MDFPAKHTDYSICFRAWKNTQRTLLKPSMATRNAVRMSFAGGTILLLIYMERQLFCNREGKKQGGRGVSDS